jgi:6-phosphogluconolactonase
MNPNIIRTKTFIKDAVDFIEQKGLQAIADHGQFVLGLCGGKTPEPIYLELARRNALKWNAVVITFGDERCVPPDHKDSNFKMAKESLFDRVGILPENIHRIKGEYAPEEAAKKYEDELSRIQQDSKSENTIIVHDLLLLGIGDDGHTASLFPGSKALLEHDRLVVANYVEKFDSYRITFTYKILNNSRNICFLVNDQSKDHVVNEILKSNPLYPASGVKAKESVTWIIGS